MNPQSLSKKTKGRIRPPITLGERIRLYTKSAFSLSPSHRGFGCLLLSANQAKFLEFGALRKIGTGLANKQRDVNTSTAMMPRTTTDESRKRISSKDGVRAIVGSINLAPGSFDSRREQAIEVHDEEVVDRIHKVIKQDWGTRTPWT